MTPLYLDHAAAAPLDSGVLAQMLPYLQEQYYNPSALYAAGQQTRQVVESARAVVAAELGCRPAELIFTAGASEANNLAISGVMAGQPDAEIVASAVEHDSVLVPARQYDCRIAAVDTSGIVQLDGLIRQVTDRTRLVSVMYANNEVGSVQPIRRLSQALQEVRRDRVRRGVVQPLYLHVDAAQAANYLSLQVSRLGVDLLSLNGSKLYGPKQSGVLYVRAGIRLRPLVFGGGQEQGLRSGTENVAGIVGFSAALRLAADMRQQELRRLGGLQDYFFAELARRFPGSAVNGSRKQRLPNNLHFSLPGQDNERLLYQLDARGIQAAAGSACSAASGTPSHVLAAIGQDSGQARSSLRLTTGRGTTRAGLEYCLDTLQELVAG